MRFIFFTKTAWDEPARLRHQLARLLATSGHEVIFFVRPACLGTNARVHGSPEPRVQLHQHGELIHHKLRVSRGLHRINAEWIKRGLTRALRPLQVSAADVVVNFNYDYFFLRDLFPTQKLITVINDDHWSRAILGYERPLRSALANTCSMSDVVLAVSEPLLGQLRPFCSPKLFHPWSDIPYTAPRAGCDRNELLYWGYIGDKIDYAFVARLACLLSKPNAGMHIRFVGPVVTGHEKAAAGLEKHGVTVTGATDLSDLPLDRVAAGLIPYRSGVKGIDAIALPNKALILLARGVPLAITGMPAFVKGEFVFRLGQGEACDLAVLRDIRKRFFTLQSAIEEFVDANSAQVRLRTFLEYARASDRP